MIQAFALPNLGAMSFQCHSLEKVFETMYVFLNKQCGEKRNKREKERKKRKERKNGVEKKSFYFKSKQLSDLLHTCHE